MNRVYRYTYAFKVISRYFDKRYREDLEEDVQKWLISEEHSLEKEQALEEFWDSLEIEADEKAVYGSLLRVKQKAGMGGMKRRLSPARVAMRIAAVLLPLVMLAGGAFLYYNSVATQPIPFKTVAVSGTETVCETLPDGTRVWLNAGSEIVYPEKFTGDSRKVYLKGEAFFDVTRSEDTPFIVETDRLNIRVLGTEFNVKAYQDEASSVTLVTGKVEVEAGTEEIFSLEPAQQLLLDNVTSYVSLFPVERTDASVWTSGNLIFDNATLDEMFRTLERTRGVNIIANEMLLTPERFSVKFVNDESVEDVLNILGILTGGFSYVLEHNTIWVNY